MPRGLAAVKSCLAATCAALALATAAAHGQSDLERAIEARGRGAIFESNAILRQAPQSAAARIELAINALYLGQYRVARETLAAVIADPAASAAAKDRALAWISQVNSQQLSQRERGGFSLDSALGYGSDDNANNSLQSGTVDDFDTVPEFFFSPERRDDGYAFYSFAAAYSLEPGESANLGGHPFLSRWTNAIEHYGRRFGEVDSADAQYTRLVSTVRFEKFRRWSGRASLSALDYRYGGDPLVTLTDASARFRRLLEPVNVGVQATVQRLSYEPRAWAGRTGNRYRVEFFIDGDLTPRQSFHAGIEPQSFSADSDYRSFGGLRVHLAHSWRADAWRVHSRLIYEKNDYDAVEPGYFDARLDDRLRVSVSAVRRLTERLELALTAKHLRSDSNHKLRELGKNQLEMSVRYGL